MPVTPPRREPARRTKTREPLTRDDVVINALAIIDQTGFDSLTMRALAHRLGVYPATLYWHAGNRAQLLALVSQRVLEDVNLAPLDIDWREWVDQMGRAIRTTFAAHPNLAVYVTSQLQVSLVGLQLAESSLLVLKRAGFKGETLLMAYNTLMAGIFGWMASEFAVDPAEADSEWRERFEQQLLLADQDALPTLRGEMSVLANRAFMLRWSSAKVMPMTSSFDFMLATLIAGLEVMVERCSEH